LLVCQQNPQQLAKTLLNLWTADLIIHHKKLKICQENPFLVTLTQNPDDWSNKGSQNKEKEFKHNTPGYTKKKLTLMQTKVSF
jgi:hypothetical protein